MVKNIAVIGDENSIKGFGAIGFDEYICSEPEKAPSLLRRIADSELYAVIYMTEELFELSEKERKRYEERLIPAVIPIPGAGVSTGIGTRRLSAFVEQAVGSDILFND